MDESIGIEKNPNQTMLNFNLSYPSLTLTLEVGFWLDVVYDTLTGCAKLFRIPLMDEKGLRPDTKYTIH